MSESEEGWDGLTLEDWVRRMFAQGQIETVVQVMNTLPESKREYYRNIWRTLANEKREKSHERSEDG